MERLIKDKTKIIILIIYDVSVFNLIGWVAVVFVCPLYHIFLFGTDSILFPSWVSVSEQGKEHKKNKNSLSLWDVFPQTQIFCSYSTRYRFIQCDEWGNAWVMPCEPGTFWSQDHYDCIKKGDPAPSPGPTITCSSTDISVPDPCDQHAYYNCVNGEAMRKECFPSDLFYNTVTKLCSYDDVNATPIDASCDR